MIRSPALPFFLVRSQDTIGGEEITSTTETVDGLLRVDGDSLVVQWRLSRETDRIGEEIRTDRELEPVREVILPLGAVASASVRASRWRWLMGPDVVLTASDLRAFEEITGAAGLRLDHPAMLELRIRRRDVAAAREFAADLNLLLADRAVLFAEALHAAPPRRGLSTAGERGGG